MRLTLCLLLLVLTGIALPATAVAHVRSGLLAFDFKARVEATPPALGGLGARVLGGDQRLELRVAARSDVIVLGVESEPFLRFSRGGVEVNLASLTAASAQVVSPADAVTGSGVTWRRLTSKHVFAWHESRLRPVPFVRGSETEPRRIATWAIPLRVDGRRATLTGGQWFAAAPPLWPWLLGGAGLLGAAAVAAARTRARQVRERIASALIAVAVVALLAGWLGIAFGGRSTLLHGLLAAVVVVVVALCLIVALRATRDLAQVILLALIGALAATFAIPELPVFTHGFVVSALPALLQRLAVATAIVAGSSAVLLALPTVLGLLEAPQPRAGEQQGFADSR